MQITILLVLLVSCKTQSRVGEEDTGLNFIDSNTLTAAIDEAIAQDKLVFVDFYADWCLPCKMMDEDVFTDPQIIQFFDKHFVSLKVDGEKNNGPNLAFMYSVKEYPTLLFLDTKGRVLTRKAGAAYQTELMKLANAAIEQDAMPEE